MDTIDDLRAPLLAFLDGELGPVETCETICAAALGRHGHPWPWIWLLWAALGERHEGGPFAARQVEEQMRLAAREWLALESEETAWRAYFHRWLQAVPGPQRMMGLPSTHSG